MTDRCMPREERRELEERLKFLSHERVVNLMVLLVRTRHSFEAVMDFCKQRAAAEGLPVPSRAARCASRRSWASFTATEAPPPERTS